MTPASAPASLPAVIRYLPPLDPGSRLADGTRLTNRWRGAAAGAWLCAVLTRVTVMAVSWNPIVDEGVLDVWRQTSSIALPVLT